MADAPSPSELRDAVGISMSYASMILGGSRQPPRPLALHIYRATGWRHSSVVNLSDEQIDVLESLEPWVPKRPAQDVVAA